MHERLDMGIGRRKVHSDFVGIVSILRDIQNVESMEFCLESLSFSTKFGCPPTAGVTSSMEFI